MTLKTKLFIRTLARHFSLRIKYMSDLPSKVPGFLDPSKATRTIVVNANKSKSDHAFTILHEIAHYTLHCERSHGMRLPWYLTRRWKSGSMIRFSKLAKRVVSPKFDEEWQADVWAMGALLYIRATDDLQAILTQYPDKNRLVCVCVVGSVYANITTKLKNAFRPIYSLYQTFMKAAKSA